MCQRTSNTKNSNTSNKNPPNKRDPKIKIRCKNYYGASSQIPLTSSASSSASASSSFFLPLISPPSYAAYARAHIRQPQRPKDFFMALVVVMTLPGEQAARLYYFLLLWAPRGGGNEGAPPWGPNPPDGFTFTTRSRSHQSSPVSVPAMTESTIPSVWTRPIFGATNITSHAPKRSKQIQPPINPQPDPNQDRNQNTNAQPKATATIGRNAANFFLRLKAPRSSNQDLRGQKSPNTQQSLVSRDIFQANQTQTDPTPSHLKTPFTNSNKI